MFSNLYYARVPVSYVEVPELPLLAFCVRFSSNGQTTVLHGSKVALGEAFVTDGIWDAPFSSPPKEENIIFGNAVVFTGTGAHLISSCCPADRLLVIRTESETFVSNSLPVLLGSLGDALDPLWPWYRSQMLAAESGFAKATRMFPTRDGRKFRVMWNEVGHYSDGRITYSTRSTGPSFKSYDDYIAMIRSTLALLVENATSQERTDPLTVIPSLSSGYDSTAIAVLANELNIDTAYTLQRFNPDDPTTPVDSPDHASEYLGTRVIPFQRNTWKTADDGRDADIAAASVTFLDCVFLAYQDNVEGKVLMLGQYGDNVWDRNNFRVFDDIHQSFGVMDGRSLAEHRLRFGYVILPPAMIHHASQESLFEISNSNEMTPWRVGGAYDRPIPRRIAEDAGIPRGSFAVKKYGGSGRVGTTITRYVGKSRAERLTELGESLTGPGAADYLDFVADLERNGTISFEHGWQKWRLKAGASGFWLYEKIDALNFRVGRRLHSKGVQALIPRSFIRKLGEKSKVNLDYTYLLPHWGTTRVMERFPDLARSWQIQ